MKSCAHIALDTLFLFVPEFFCVLLFGYIIKISVIVHDPTAVTAECVFVPFSFGVLAPFLAVALAEADAVLLVKVNADRNRFVFHHEGQRFPLLHHFDFGIAEFQFLCQYLEVAGDDLCGNGHDLVGLGVDLHEYLGLAAVRPPLRSLQGWSFRIEAAFSAPRCISPKAISSIPGRISHRLLRFPCARKRNGFAR